MKKIDSNTAMKWWERISTVFVLLIVCIALGPWNALWAACIIAGIVGVFYILFKAPDVIQSVWNYFATEDENEKD